MNKTMENRLTSTWLLTWNPDRFHEKDSQYSLEELENEIAQLNFSISKWSCGVTTSIKPGDRVFLIRLGKEPRGIVASGYAISEVFTGTHWDEERRKVGVLAKRIYVRFEDIRLRDELLLPIQALKMYFPSVHWSSQASGIRIPSDVASSLIEMWKRET